MFFLRKVFAESSQSFRNIFRSTTKLCSLPFTAFRSSSCKHLVRSIPTRSGFVISCSYSTNLPRTLCTMASVNVCEYGAWPSPISSEVAAGSDIQFNGLEKDSSSSSSSDVIYWIEQRPAEAGRNVICSWNPSTKKVVEWTPSEFNVKTKVHEYGGGSFCVFKHAVYFVNKADQAIYAQSCPEEPPRLITKTPSARRFADLFYSEYFDCIFAVCEDRGIRDKDVDDAAVDESKTKEIPDNYIATIDTKSGKVTCIVSGADFYARPRTSSAGLLIWMEWNFPNMPWDNTSIKWARLSSPTQPVNVQEAKNLVSKNGQKEVAFTFPSFSPSGKILYISDEDDWWNLFMTDENQTNKICLDEQKADIGHPMWIFGWNFYNATKLTDSDNTAIVFSYGKDLILLILDPVGNMISREILETGYKFHSLYNIAVSNGVYSIGFDAKTPAMLFYLDFKSRKIESVRASSTLQLEGYLSEPMEIEFPTGENESAFAYYYPPVNKDVKAPVGSLPPVLVKMHGGPTSQSDPKLSPKIQFYTSRGFGVLDVNYRGSSGYGRKYRQKLNLKWGASDVEDAVNGVKYLIAKGLADKNRVCISGGSAGGLSVLNALLHYDTFCAGASHYGVTDLEALVKDTHKFEMRYLDLLIGEYPKEIKVYEERSPIHNKEKLKCPVVFFQGLDDFVVPPSQSENMFNAVKAKGLPCAYVTFEGEGHGFTKKENIQKALDTEYAFFVKVFKIDAPHVRCDVSINNL